MNEKLNDFIINTMISHYEGNIFEYKLADTGRTAWGVNRCTSDIKQLIVFGDIQSRAVICESINNYISESDDKGIQLLYVLIAADIQEVGNTEWIRMGLTANTLKDSTKIILIDEVKGEVVYYDQDVFEIAQILQTILNYKMSLNENKDVKKSKLTVTNVIIAINVIMFLLTWYLSGNLFDPDTKVLVYLGAKYNPAIDAGEYYRLLTAMFLHGGIIHIGFNMYALNSLGPIVENIYGKLNFIVIYIIAGLVGSYFSYMFSPGVSVGASGAIFGLMGAAVVIGLRMKDRIGGNFISNILQVIGVNLLLGFTLSNVDNFGHLGGLIGGIIIAFILRRRIKI